MSLRSLLGLVSNDLAIDLGTTNTRVLVREKGVVLDEPTLVARNARTGGYEAFGREAHEMLGRTPAGIELVRPLEEGVIADDEAAQALLDHFVRKAQGRSRIASPRVVIGVPSGIRPAQAKDVRAAAHAARASEVLLVPEAMAAAMGAGLPVEDPSGNVICDVGGGATDVAVISMAGIVWSGSIRVAGDAMDKAIAAWVRHEHGLLIGARTAEHVKLRVGSASELEEPGSCEISGRDRGEGVPRTIVVTDEEIRQALTGCMHDIADLVRTALQETPAELSADVVERGIILTGGGSLLMGLERWLREATQLPVSHAEDPLRSVIVGLGRLLEERPLLEKVALS